MDNRLIECVPNFSEGKDMNIIKQITSEIESVEGVRLLDVDPGKDTNRTVVTFVGNPEAVCEAAFRAMKKASEIIDMSKHSGAHPRFGATDVCPLIPISNISMEEVAEYARKLAKRVGEELKYPVYCYEFAAFEEKRKNLANCRAGEYEGLAQKLKDPEWKPDFGPAQFVPFTGATAVGARNFLVAYNINLNTTSTRRANAVAFDVREAGRTKKDEQGNSIQIPGTLKKVKAIGWYIPEYGVCQVSMNLTDISITPVHIAFDEVCKSATNRGLRVTGSELVGLMPLQSLLDAGKYFLTKQQRSLGVSEDELIKIAVKSLGLDELKPFHPKERIIEYILDENKGGNLVKMNLTAFANETASESTAPGGGSISAYMGALGVSLACMVANLSSHKPGWDERWEEFSKWAEKGQILKDQLLKLVDEDTNAFTHIMNAFSLPKNTPEEKQARENAIQAATKYAIEVPYKVMTLAYQSFEIIEAMIEIGNPNSVTDAGVGALAARSAVLGAFFNVKINCVSYKDKNFVNEILSKGGEVEKKTLAKEKELIEKVNSKIK